MEERIAANAEARKLQISSLPDFILKNPKNWPKDYLNLVLEQYQFLQKLGLKVPDWVKNSAIVGASIRNIEQSSSAQTAKTKFAHFSGKRALDLTGGFGIDSAQLARQFELLDYCEPHEDLNEIVQHNFEALHLHNVRFHKLRAEDFLDQTENKYDLIFLDPDRRPNTDKKMVSIEDCVPNLLEIEEQLLRIANTVLVKYSPMLDITFALQKLKRVSAIKLIAVKNEMKELLFQLGEISGAMEIECVNIENDETQRFCFSLEHEKSAQVTFSAPLKYLYEPNVALLKAGAFRTVSAEFGLGKIALNSHFYTSDSFLGHFPGRKFEILAVLSPQQKQLKSFKNRALNVIARNYPLKAETLKKKFGLKDGGDEYLIFTENAERRKIAVHAKRIFN
ncbi:class I SAM-dependent methyltransferase [Marinilongibacter aquaticus]|uniref:class I SAM-dependent methyltransferase n=1 Tax=Marinilongibacter aquaticus TaxID=2975157 RepID=UPI0021BDA7A5|nr:class I SAM-dependent methyltransferase [Marinilongibacter aquaticus]UBM59852.1 class I SAM-dependent methyltransferase [Marinilongibacter aquaticus]